eukprot:TRINITY_DN2223_c1_g1_i1.p1 TRINITY_DN2223_c1_g1~~TRINITY_DN2223_c1_g1_i1.p1  ORF type:complete len:697 (-),score=244.92 TRINITY_DN2223_c1_g1_i1:220-2310(-)
MKYFLVLLLLASSSAEETVVTPAQKIVQLLNNMKLKGQTEMNEEKIQYGKYDEWCKITLASKQKDIDQGTDQIAVSQAEITKSSSDAERLQGEIGEHEADLSRDTEAKANATEVRRFEREEFEKIFLDYTESVDALSRAIKVLKAQDYKRQQAAKKAESNSSALLQSKSQSQALGERASALLELMQAPDVAKKSKAVAEFLALVQKPGVAHAYQFQSNGVVDMLSKLLDEFVKEKKAVEDAEWKKKTSFELLAQSLQLQIDATNSEVTKKKEFQGKALARKAESEDSLNEASDTKAVDEKFHQDLSTECSVKSREFAARQKLRTEEIEAIEKATEILSADTVSGAAARNLPHDAKGAALAFLRSHSVNKEKKDEGGHDVTPLMALLKQRADKIKSTSLTQLLDKVQAKASPAANLGALTMIGDMLQELLTKLQTQAEEDTTKKRWCDNEVEANTQTRAAKTENIDNLNAEIDGLTTSIAQLAEHTAQLTSEVSVLNADMAKATSLRKTDKEANAKTIQESNDAVTALNKALEVLNKFYEKAGDAEALIQVKTVKHAQKPAIFDSTYNGMQSENGGVIGMLQVLLADFERLVSETEVNEETGLNEYRDFMEDSKVDASKKKATIEHNEKKKTEQGEALAHRKADLEGNSKELSAASEYWASLKDKCLNNNADYDLSVERRNEEIQALRDALDMLENL